MCAWNNRFDDPGRSVRGLYLAELPEIAFREVLEHLRPSTEAVAQYVEWYGPDAFVDIPTRPVAASWRREQVLVEVDVEVHGDLIDLTDPAVRNALERRHARLLHDHGLSHLDLAQITSRRRQVTQHLAGDLLARGAAAIRFASLFGGGDCLAVFEDRCELTIIGQPIDLTDPPPKSLLAVCSQWQLRMEPAA